LNSIFSVSKFIEVPPYNKPNYITLIKFALSIALSEFSANFRF